MPEEKWYTADDLAETVAIIGSENYQDLPDDPRNNGSDNGVVWLSSYELKEARYIDRPLIQAATFTLVGGRPGVGKGALCAHWVARCTTGRMYPEPRRVLWLSSEDDPSIDLGPRIEAAGGDRDMVGLVPHTFQLPDSADWLIERIRDYKDIGLVIIDPISNHTGRTNTDRENEVRTALMPLGVIAHELDVPILGVRHISTKEAKGGALMHILGSTAWIGVPRVVLGAVKDPASPEIVHVRPIKGNRVPTNEAGRQFRLEGYLLPGFSETVVVAHDSGASDADIDTMLAGEAKTATQKAEGIIIDILQQNGGVMESDTLDYAVAARTGLETATLRKVRSKMSKLGVIRPLPDRDESGRATTWQVHLTTPFMPEEAASENDALSDDQHGPRAGEQEKKSLLLFPGTLHSEATTHQGSVSSSGDLQGLSPAENTKLLQTTTTQNSPPPPRVRVREEESPTWAEIEDALHELSQRTGTLNHPLSEAITLAKEMRRDDWQSSSTPPGNTINSSGSEASQPTTTSSGPTSATSTASSASSSPGTENDALPALSPSTTEATQPSTDGASTASSAPVSTPQDDDIPF